MPVYLNGLQVVPDGEYGVFEFRSKTKISNVWARIGPMLFANLTEVSARAMLNPRAGVVEPANIAHDQAFQLLLGWVAGPQIRRYPNDSILASTMAMVLQEPTMRRNYFYLRAGENENIARVIVGSVAPESSIGWSEPAFFANLGHERHPVGTRERPSPERDAEQEYLMQGMVKGAMWEAAQIAHRYRVGISVRPTGVLAHMGIEAGNPTKSQEFKNKTSKDVDLYLCDEMSWNNIGTVVHYDPRVGWTSAGAATASATGSVLLYGPPTETQWQAKRTHIRLSRQPQLEPYIRTGRIKPPDFRALREMFFSRATEYQEEDHEYRLGHYAPYTTLVGPYIRLKLAAQSNMYGDHDLFGFTMGEYGRLTLDNIATLRIVQTTLQRSNTFQAQHGGIWNWRPREAFHQSIKKKIMSSHSPPDGDPLIYILPDHKVHAAFYIPGREVLESAWDHPAAEKWMESAHSGRIVIQNREAVRNAQLDAATSNIVDWLNHLGEP